MRATVVGAGSWGTALAIILGRNGWDVRLVGRGDDDIDSLRSCRENLRYLPGFLLTKGTEVTLMDGIDAPCDLAVIAVPSAGVADVAPRLAHAPLICLASKGLCNSDDGLLSSQVATAIPGVPLGVLSGPNLAPELAGGIPTAAVAAADEDAVAERIRDAFMCRTYRIYVSNDLRGVQLAGSLKNVMALAAGISDGLGFGDNTKATLLARGLNEMARLGMKMGARLDTFLGIAGVGDLFATASSKLSRNYRVGHLIGQGRSVHGALEEVGQVAEGVNTCFAATVLARRNDISMPIFEVMQGVLREEYDPRDAVSALMERLPRREGLLSE